MARPRVPWEKRKQGRERRGVGEVTISSTAGKGGLTKEVTFTPSLEEGERGRDTGKGGGGRRKTLRQKPTGCF